MIARLGPTPLAQSAKRVAQEARPPKRYGLLFSTVRLRRWEKFEKPIEIIG
jgi:hypothetical protein